MASHVRKNDTVTVIAGAHKGARGKVLRVDARRHEVVVEGVNLVYRHVRPTKRNPKGGRLQKEAPIHLSNVQPVDPSSGKPSRVRFTTKTDPGGKVTEKQRVTVEKQSVLHVLRKVKGA